MGQKLNYTKNNKVEEILGMKAFSQLFWHYLKIYMVFKGHYSKNIPHLARKIICEQFGKSLHLPNSIIHLLQSEIVSIDQLEGIDKSTLGAVRTISKDEVINTFSHLATTI